MISIEDIVELVESNWVVRENTKKVKKLDGELVKGIVYPSINKIILYTKNIEDEDDYDLTLMHELYHAINPSANETETEEIANYVHVYFPETIKFAKHMFENNGTYTK